MNSVALIQPVATPLDVLVDDYLNHCRARGLSDETTDGNYTTALCKTFLPWCRSEGITGVQALDVGTLDRYTASLLHRTTSRGAPLSKFSVHTHIRPLRLFLTWAEHNGESVIAKPQLPKVGRRRRDVLNRAEIDQLESVATSERDKLIIRILGDCGLRLSEATYLRRGDMIRSSNRGYLHVRGKGDRDRRVPVPPRLAVRIARYITSLPVDTTTDRMFLAVRRNEFGEWTPLHRDAVGNVVDRAARRAQLGKRVHPHLFRHSWITEMLRRGMNPIQLSLIAGTSQAVIAQHYQHLNEVDAYDAMIRAMAAG